MQASIGAMFPETFAPGSQIEIIEGMGYFLHLEDPAAVGELMSGYLGTIRS